MVGGWAAVPLAKILLEDWLFSKDDIGKVDHLTFGHGGSRMFGEFCKIDNAVEDIVNRL